MTRLSLNARSETITPGGEYVVRGGYVLTLDPALGDFPSADLHVRNGEIVAVGPGLKVDGVETIDATGMIVMPGFVETHWHLWECSLRGMTRGDDAVNGYFPLTARMGPLYEPADSACAVRLGAAEALLCGITTLHNWCHNARSPAHVDAEIKALRGMRVRSRFSYGVGKDLAPTLPMDINDLRRVKDELSDDKLLQLGVGLRTPSLQAGVGSPIDVVQMEMSNARPHRLPMTMHGGGKGLVSFLASHGVLGDDLMMVHPQGMSAEECRVLADAGSSYSIAPVIESSYSAIRNGPIQFHELDDLGVALGLSVDSSAASANADVFTLMRALMWASWRQSAAPVKLQPRRLVELATIDGARLLNLADKTGSLVPGKRADFIMVRAGDANMAPMVDPYYSLVFSGQPGNIEMVAVDGEILCRGGRLLYEDIESIVADATRSVVRMQARSLLPQ